MRGADAYRARVGAFDEPLLEVAKGAEHVEHLGDAPALEDMLELPDRPVVEHIRVGLTDVDHAAPGQQLRRRHRAIHVADRSTGDIERRTRSDDYIALRLDRDRAAGRGAFTHRARDALDRTRHIGQRGASPAPSVRMGPGPARVDDYRGAAERPIALQRTVFELIGAEFYLDRVPLAR